MKKTSTTKSKKGMSVKQKLSVISSRLRRGDISEISAKLKYDQSHVSRVLRGIRNNESIVNEAYSRVSKRKATA